MRLMLKVAIVAFMTLAILVPLLMIRGIINDRQLYRAQAVEKVVRSYAGAQTFSGPVLVVPYTELVETETRDGRGLLGKTVRRESFQWVFFPTALDVGGTLVPDTRRLGLHKVRVYEWKGTAAASFEAVLPPAGDPSKQRAIGRPRLSYAFADVRGLTTMPKAKIDGVEAKVEEGRAEGTGSGVHVPLAIASEASTIRLRAELSFDLRGTESLSLVPLGKSNRFDIASNWPHPLFGGSFLPGRPDIGDAGFRAVWQVASVATNAQQQFLDSQSLPLPGAPRSDREKVAPAPLDAVSVSLVDPVDVYTLSDRATKYGLLFVLLTFVGFFIFELVKQLPIHPIQYGLVGLALAIFFLLLVSLSEHIAFDRAYLISAAACVGLLGFYLSSVLRSWARGLGFAAMLGSIYGLLYGLLISEDNALVLGAGLLFLVLAAIMVITRKIDWYRLGNSKPPAIA